MGVVVVYFFVVVVLFFSFSLSYIAQCHPYSCPTGLLSLCKQTLNLLLDSLSLVLGEFLPMYVGGKFYYTLKRKQELPTVLHRADEECWSHVISMATPRPLRHEHLCLSSPTMKGEQNTAGRRPWLELVVT